MQRCRGQGCHARGGAARRAAGSTHGTSCGCPWCAWRGKRSRGGRRPWRGASPRGTGRRGAGCRCCRSTWHPDPAWAQRGGGGGEVWGGHGWVPPQGATPLPPTRLPSPPWHSAGRSWRTARPPRRRPSCPRGTAGAGPRGANPCPPSPPRGACGTGTGMGTGLGPSPFAGPRWAPCGAGAVAHESRSGWVPTRVRVPAPYPQRGQRRRPSDARPRRQLAQKLW